MSIAIASSSLWSAELPAQWQNVQSFELKSAGLTRISVPLETLTAAREGLGDLRLYDGDAREVPYFLERPVQPKPSNRISKNVQTSVTPDETVVQIVTDISEPIAAVSLETPVTEFLKAVTVEGSTDGKSWTSLVRNAPLFRQAGGANRLRLNLTPGVWPQLKLTLDDRRSKPIAITGVVLHTEAAAASDSEALPLQVLHRSEEAGQTRFELQLSGTHCTLAELDITATDPLFTRQVALAQQQFIENEVRETVLDRGTIYRISIENQPTAAELAFAVDVAVQSRGLVVTVQNGDSPPLAIQEISARRRPVYLTFLAAQPGHFSLLSGNAQCPDPRYDVAALATKLHSAAVAQVAWQALKPNPVFNGTDELAGIEVRGIPLDVSAWHYRKHVTPGAGRVQQLELDLQVLARSGASFADLRLISGGKQIPYVLERTSLSRSFAVLIAPVEKPRAGTSQWRLSLPYHPLPVSRLTFSVADAYFKRAMTLTEQIPDARGNVYTQVLASGLWVRRPEQKDTTLSVILATQPRSEQLTLELENGDNPPLQISEAKAWHTLMRILFTSTQGNAVDLYYGNTDAHAPRYDVELLVPRLLAAQKSQVSLAPEEVLKSDSALISLNAAGWLLWVVLGGIVVVLFVVIAKLLPKPPKGE